MLRYKISPGKGLLFVNRQSWRTVSLTLFGIVDKAGRERPLFLCSPLPPPAVYDKLASGDIFSLPDMDGACAQIVEPKKIKIGGFALVGVYSAPPHVTISVAAHNKNKIDFAPSRQVVV